MKLNDKIFWIKNSLRPRAVKQYKEALANQYKGEKIRKTEWERQKELVNYAYKTIPFYREFYDANGFNPNKLNTQEDWNKIPILEKWMVRKNVEKIIAPNAPKNEVGISTTGGSTGMPLKIYTDKRYNFEVLGWRAFSWWGISPGDNVGIAHRRVPKRKIDKIKNRLLWWPTRRIYLSSTSITEDEIRYFVQQINKKHIVWLQGYVGTLEKIADYICQHNIKITSIKMVWSTSAPLMKNVRQKMEKAFGCKIMNQYGCCEVPNIAIQCPYSQHLHINADVVHVDTVDSHGRNVKGEEGDILITNLTSFHFPLIKYRLGDRGTLLDKECTCGVKLPLLMEVRGRTSDAIYTPYGLYIDGSFLTTIFDKYCDYIDQFQIRQKSDYSISVFVKIKTSNTETLRVLDNILLELTEIVRKQVPVKVEIVDSINNDDNGKIRYILSEIALNKVKKENNFIIRNNVNN